MTNKKPETDLSRMMARIPPERKAHKATYVRRGALFFAIGVGLVLLAALLVPEGLAQRVLIGLGVAVAGYGLVTIDPEMFTYYLKLAVATARDFRLKNGTNGDTT